MEVSGRKELECRDLPKMGVKGCLEGGHKGWKDGASGKVRCQVAGRQKVPNKDA